MKMQSFRRPRRLFSSIGGLAGAVILGVGLIVLLLRFAAPDAFTAAFSPVTALGRMGAAAVALPESASAVRAERDALAAQVEALTAENKRLSAELADSSRLAASSGTIAAGIMAGPPLAPYDVLIVAAGTSAGVSNGALAYGPGGVPVGTVGEVSAGFSRVLLYSASGRETQGWVGDKRLPLTVVGAGAGAYSASVPTDAQVAVGDIVYLPGPGAIPVGSVIKIDANPSSPRATLSIRPLINPFTLTTIALSRDAAL